MDSWDVGKLEVTPHHPEVLRSDIESRAIAINLPAGERLQEHETYERGWLLVADGRVEVEHDGRSVEGGTGFLAHFAPQERREVRALDDTRLVLILVPWPGKGHPNFRE